MAAASSFAGSGAGPPGVGQFRLDVGVGLQSYPGLEETYRQSSARSYERSHMANEKHELIHGPSPSHHSAGGQFGILAPTTVPAGVLDRQQDAARHVSLAIEAQNVNPGRQPEGSPGEKSQGKAHGKIVVDPPDLAAWRERLFNVDEMIILSQEQFETYFPHVDNVYSHRSTQKYKRKPFISHYWDCRMKGRPAGTPKSEDPSKKKRKRNARERDLCDVKIRITEYFPNAGAYVDREAADAAAAAGETLPVGQRFWTIQRVNGNGGNGKADGVAGPHRHTLAKSDEIKKNSVQRYLAQQEKETKKARKPLQRKATGSAAATARKHSKEQDLKLYSSCYCPFSQRIWISLEAKGIPYQYCEPNTSHSSSDRTALDNRDGQSIVPSIRHGDFECAESTAILEYLEDLGRGTALLPPDPKLRAKCRQWIHHVNRRIVPAFYSLLQAQEPNAQSTWTEHLHRHISSLMAAADEEGPFFLGSTVSLVDIHFAPFAIRLSRVLRPLRGWADPIPNTRWQIYLEALEHNPHIQATTSLSELYADTAELLAHGHSTL